jgi:hypothetical protein
MAKYLSAMDESGEIHRIRSMKANYCISTNIAEARGFLSLLRNFLNVTLIKIFIDAILFCYALTAIILIILKGASGGA